MAAKDQTRDEWLKDLTKVRDVSCGQHAIPIVVCGLSSAVEAVQSLRQSHGVLTKCLQQEDGALEWSLESGAFALARRPFKLARTASGPVLERPYAIWRRVYSTLRRGALA